MSNRKFVFVSDFDGTLIEKDFYQLIIDDYLGEEGYYLFSKWRESKYKEKDFLYKIYKSVSTDEKEALKEILRVQWDDSVDEVIKKIQEAGGDFIILSNGTRYYIDNLLNERGISGVQVYTNLWEYENKGISLRKSGKEYDFYSIDKEMVLHYLRERYSYIYYAGDSVTDMSSCKLADECFAKGALQHILRDEKVDFIPIESFNDVKKHLINKGVISSEDV